MYYQGMAIRNISRNEDEIKNVIYELKKKGLQSQINNEITKIKNKTPNIPLELAYIKDNEMYDYLHDVNILKIFADYNRRAIADDIINNMGWSVHTDFTTLHNYIDVSKMILRKGAVSALDGELLIIPMNMRDGSLLCIGKGNPDWNYSAPHGAGRLMSRGQAKGKLSMDKYISDMKNNGIYTTSVNENTLDECADAYKPMDDIIKHIEDTVEVVEQIKPVYNFKSSKEIH